LFKYKLIGSGITEKKGWKMTGDFIALKMEKLKKTLIIG